MAVKNQIIAYIRNQGNKLGYVKEVDFESIEKEYNISITLQGIHKVKGTNFENHTNSLQVRWFIASYCNHSKTDTNTNLSGWIDEYRKINEWEIGAPVQPSETVTTSQNNDTIPVTSETVEASNRFAFDLYKSLRETENNIFFSPYSISTAFSMVYEGAKGTTAEEIQNVFHLNVNTLQRLTENKELYNTVNDQRGCELNTANALWIQTGYPVLEDFRGKLSEYYQAEARELNLAGDPEGSRNVINSWVENQTKKKISELFPPCSFNMGTRLVLANALYFKGVWLYQFNPEETELKPFKVSPDRNVTVDMMRLHDMYVNYTETSELQIIKLPYVNSSISMIILLPKNKTLTEIEQGLNYEQLNAWISGFS